MSRADDRNALLALLRHPDLTEPERDAFVDMDDWLDVHEKASLSVRQRSWVDGSLKKYDLDAPADNSKVPVGRSVPAYEALVAGRPLKPPGRR